MNNLSNLLLVSIFSGEVGNDTSPVLAQCCFDLVEILMGKVNYSNFIRHNI